MKIELSPKLAAAIYAGDTAAIQKLLAEKDKLSLSDAVRAVHEAPAGPAMRVALEDLRSVIVCSGMASK